MASPRTRKSALMRSLDQATIPVYVVSSERRIIYCNEALCNWTGQAADFLEEMVCDYSINPEMPHSDLTANGLCPNPQAFHGDAASGFVFTEKDGDPEFRSASFIPLQTAESDNNACPVLVVASGDPTRSAASLDRDSIPKDLHQAVCEMQYESKHQINLDVIVGSSPAARKVRRQMDVAIESNADLIVAGPSGSGRGLIAELIHYAKGPHIAGPLIPIDCRMCDAEMIQSTIKDLYRQSTDYPDEPLGRLLFKDIDHLPLAAQNELLGFIELQDFQLPMVATVAAWPVRSVSDESKTDSSFLDRIVSHISTIVIQVPSLADRKEDIAYLVQSMIERMNSSHNRQLSGATDSAMELLQTYHWPGELSELMQTIAAAAESASGNQIDATDLPAHLTLAVRSQQSTVQALQSIDLDQFLSDMEMELIERAVRAAEGNRSKAAKLLGISRARLLRRIKDPASFEQEETQ